MKLMSIACATLIGAIALAQSAGQQIEFKRTYKDKAVAQYKLTLDIAGEGQMAAVVQTTVKSVDSDGATVLYKTISMKVGDTDAPADQLVELTSKSGPKSMPEDLDFDKHVAYLALSAAGITSGASETVGLDIPIHWQNAAKNVELQGHGKISAMDTTAKTINVDWDFSVTPKGEDPGQFKISSVYSTDDFSLKSSKGKLTIGGKEGDFAVIQQEIKS